MFGKKNNNIVLYTVSVLFKSLWYDILFFDFYEGYYKLTGLYQRYKVDNFSDITKQIFNDPNIWYLGRTNKTELLIDKKSISEFSEQA